MSRRAVWYRRACALAAGFSLFSLAALTTGDPGYWKFLGFLGFLMFLVPTGSAGRSATCPLAQPE